MAMLGVTSLRDSRFLKTARANAHPRGAMLGKCGMTISQEQATVIPLRDRWNLKTARAQARPKGAVHGGTA